MNIKAKGCIRFFIMGAIGLAFVCLVLVVISNLVYRVPSHQSSVIDRLSEVDKARLAEVFHLRQELGNEVMPGWSQANIPVILYNEQYLFLVGSSQPEEGWQTVPQGKQMGQEWEMVRGEEFLGQPYYRQPLPAPGQNTQAFTVRVGNQWAASLATWEWMRISMADEVSQNFPEPLQPVVPSGLFTKLLVPGSDAYVSMILHEAMHAYQGIRAADRLSAAEQSSREFGKQYPLEDKTFQAAWQNELDVLNQAMRATSPEETLRLTQAFLKQRTERRKAANLSANLIDLERQREWEEGIAKYGELSIALQAARTEDYQPLPELNQDPEFHHYQGAQRKCDQEIDQIRRMASDKSDTRFYYSGFAQAVLLDRLAPGWKEHLFNKDVWLENLLAEAARHP